jgi:hypothetical protein
MTRFLHEGQGQGGGAHQRRNHDTGRFSDERGDFYSREIHQRTTPEVTPEQVSSFFEYKGDRRAFIDDLMTFNNTAYGDYMRTCTLHFPKGDVIESSWLEAQKLAPDQWCLRQVYTAVGSEVNTEGSPILHTNVIHTSTDAETVLNRMSSFEYGYTEETAAVLLDGEVREKYGDMHFTRRGILEGFAFDEQTGRAARTFKGMIIEDGAFSEAQRAMVKELFEQQQKNITQSFFDRYISVKGSGVTGDDFFHLMEGFRDAEDVNRLYGGYTKVLRAFENAVDQRFSSDGLESHFRKALAEYGHAAKDLPKQFKDFIEKTTALFALAFELEHAYSTMYGLNERHIEPGFTNDFEARVQKVQKTLKKQGVEAELLEIALSMLKRAEDIAPAIPSGFKDIGYILTNLVKLREARVRLLQAQLLRTDIQRSPGLPQHVQSDQKKIKPKTRKTRVKRQTATP